MDITIAVVAYNEEDTRPKVFENIIEQSYPHEHVEVVLVDSMSEDGTRDLMRTFAVQNNEEFLNIQVIENPGKMQSCGWNRAIEAFTTEALIRLDAHGSIPADFVERNVKALEEGEYVTGGARPSITNGDSPWQEVLLTAESSMFGSSAASFRRGSAASPEREEEKSYVKSLFHGAYRREVFEKAGRFREDLGRTEDNEFHYRIRQNGFPLCMVPGIVSYQKIRPDLRKMCHQKYANGYWVGLTSGVCPGCLSLYHFVPLAFVAGIIVTTILAVCSHPLLAVLMWTVYGALSVVMAVLAVRGQRKRAGHLLLPVLFLLLHVSYGVGTLVGILQMPFWKRRHNSYESE